MQQQHTLLAENLNLLAQAGLKVGENDLLFKAIVKVVQERKEIERDASVATGGAKNKKWRNNPRRTVAFEKRSRSLSPSRRRSPARKIRSPARRCSPARRRSPACGRQTRPLKSKAVALSKPR